MTEIISFSLSQEAVYRENLKSSSSRDGGSPSQFLETLEQIVNTRAWERLMDDDGNQLTFTRLVCCPPPVGSGVSKDTLKTLIQLKHRHEDHNAKLHERMRTIRQEVVRLIDEDEELGNPGGDRTKQVDNINLNLGGTSENYTRRRLRRDRPDLYERVLTKELSANKAAQLAGFRRTTATVYVDTPEAAIDGLLRRFTFDQLERALAKHG